MKGWAILLLNLAAMAVLASALLVLVFKWIDSYTRHGQYIEVPDVSGMIADDALAVIDRYGLRSQVTDYRYDSGMQENEVIEQRPAAGAYVKGGHIICLTLNSGKVPMKAVPDVADNSSMRAAQSKLLAAGFKLTEPEYIPGDPDWVYEVRLGNRPLKAGEQIPEGSSLTIVVGDGGAVADSVDAGDDMLMDTDFFQN